MNVCEYGTMGRSSGGARSGGPPRTLGTLSEKRLRALPSASRTSRLEYQLEFATGLFSQRAWAKSGSWGSLKKAAICRSLRASPGRDSSMRKFPQVSWGRTVGATVVARSRWVRTAVRPSTDRDIQRAARMRPANQNSRRLETPGTMATAKSQAARAAQTMARSGGGPAPRKPGAAAASETDRQETSFVWEPWKASRKATARTRKTATRKTNKLSWRTNREMSKSQRRSERLELKTTRRTSARRTRIAPAASAAAGTWPRTLREAGGRA